MRQRGICLFTILGILQIITLKGFQETSMAQHIMNLMPLMRVRSFQDITWILDVGAYDGGWTREMKGIFKDANYFLIEGNAEHKEALELSGEPYIVSLVGDVDNEDVIFYRADITRGITAHGNSVYREQSGFFSDENTIVEERKSYTIDSILEIAGLGDTAFQIIKLDVQGSEYKALKGAKKLLSRSQPMVITEISILPFNGGEAASFFDVRLGHGIHWLMESMNYMIAGFVGHHYAKDNNNMDILIQIDVAWMKRENLMWHSINTSIEWQKKQWSCTSPFTP